VGKRSLYTIGYEGADLGDFIATLKSENIQQVIDIRELPLSRKRGFSKNALKDALAKRAISYLHVTPLGDPKAGRTAARSGDFVTFRRLYNAHLRQKDSQEALLEASKAAMQKISVLLCYELDYKNCHRSIVANSLSNDFDFAVKHISVGKTSTQKSRQKDDHNNTGVGAFG
jgi:uncharacterized protein (DUF488 family)